MTQSPPSIEHLNTDCTCTTLDLDALCRMAETVVGDAAFCNDLAKTHPHLLSARSIFLSADHAAQMQAIISGIEQVAATPQYQAAALANAPQIATYVPGPIGIFMGYDFHLGEQGPRLIEINTNAGGALLNAYLLQAQKMCCATMASQLSPDPIAHEALLNRFIADFESEWTRQGRTGRPRTAAIIDLIPHEQYLFPEFVLFQRLFESHGVTAKIAAPDDLIHRDGALWHGELPIDLVYNRLTDFDLAEPASAALRTAYLAGDVVVSPNPRAHALYANKTNLALLTNEPWLRTCGVNDETIATLTAGIPRTQILANLDPETTWVNRNQLFFKPARGYGGKATYRGDKLTKKVWADIQNHDYVAQQLVPPSTRMITIDGERQSLKADLRAYTYQGEIRLMAARLYQGQTTNFRTPGGGFAPVIVSATNLKCECS